MKKAPTRKDFEHEFPNVGFYRTAHHQALEKWVEEAEEHIKKLEHHRDTTIGLFATDRPDLISDPKKVLFKINDY